MHTLLIDNDDSFTWNLVQQVRSLGSACTVLRHRDVSLPAIHTLAPDRIILSPGPGSPGDAVGSLRILRDPTLSTPLLGVCLGHQCLAHVFDRPSSVIHAPSLMHGKTSEIFHTGESIFQDIPSPFLAARYHSLCVRRVPPAFRLLCWTGTAKEPDVIMGMRHDTRLLFGVQFHPESFLTHHGNAIMNNFLHGRW